MECKDQALERSAILVRRNDKKAEITPEIFHTSVSKQVRLLKSKEKVRDKHR